jgi:hypothetical protein
MFGITQLEWYFFDNRRTRMHQWTNAIEKFGDIGNCKTFLEHWIAQIDDDIIQLLTVTQSSTMSSNYDYEYR